MKNQRLSWHRPASDLVELSGEIDEDSNLTELASALEGRERVRINLRKINRINSVGVREWTNFIRRVSESTSVVLEECSAVIVSQLNMITGFSGKAKVASVMAPYVCDACGTEDEVLIDTAEVASGSALKPPSCPECSDDMELDDLPDSYFAFVRSGSLR